jgi:hypothetical protein
MKTAADVLVRSHFILIGARFPFAERFPKNRKSFMNYSLLSVFISVFVVFVVVLVIRAKKKP